MGNFFKNLKIRYLVVCLLLLSCHDACALGPSLAECKVALNGTAITIWHNENSGHLSIEAAVGRHSAHPNTWARTTLSSSINMTNNFNSHLYINANGDAVVIWQYLGSNNNGIIAASIYSSEFNTWASGTISSTSLDARYLDHKASISDSGDIVVTWTSYDSSLNANQVIMSTATVNSGVWSPPIVIAP